ncbi:MAG: hypothetical protein KGL39_18025 [Patescibacteria group bacterium]|nr:hypothetical protein [Patescibacteria group bacterium]
MYLFCERGDTVSWTFQIYDGDLPRDLSGDLVQFSVKNSLDDADVSALLHFKSTTTGITILPQTGATLGQFLLTILPADTTSFKAGLEAYWDIQLTLSDGSVVTPFQGTIIFTGDVTKSTS